MNTSRYQSQRPRRSAEFLGVSRMFWSGTVLVTGVLLGILYCLLTHRVPL
ncbi:MAG: hypothetical protein WD872_03190 [Pirellulaceae bacterium]